LRLALGRLDTFGSLPLGFGRPLLGLNPVGALVAREMGLVLKDADGLLDLFQDVREDFEFVGARPRP
jgi:hypothetical protein